MVRGANDGWRIMIKELLPRALGHTNSEAVAQQSFLSTDRTVIPPTCETGEASEPSEQNIIFICLQKKFSDFCHILTFVMDPLSKVFRASYTVNFQSFAGL